VQRCRLHYKPARQRTTQATMCLYYFSGLACFSCKSLNDHADFYTAAEQVKSVYLKIIQNQHF
ncbi:MAG: hypothetical protein ACKVIK_10835, partial [Rhodospirillales bacterium]